MTAPGYWLERGFPAPTIEALGLGVEVLDGRAVSYGLEPGVEVAVIPYPARPGRPAFERVRVLDAESEHHRRGKYRQPAGVGLDLFDPWGVLEADEPLDALLLVEGEANAVAARELEPSLPVVGLPGQRALRADLAQRLAHLPVVYLWLDNDESGYEASAARVDALIREAGVGEVLLVDSAGIDCNEALLHLGHERGAQALRDALDQAAPLERERAEARDDGRRGAVDGATFILDAPAHVPAVWGRGRAVAWSEGEPLLVVGPAGVGKTSLGQQLALRRAGIGTGELLGMDVAPDGRRLLYVAADRPHQAARSFRRMVEEADRDALAGRLVCWPGPLPFDLLADPGRLADFAEGFGAGTIVLDSLKDVALELSRDEVGARLNLALQHVVAAGVEVVGLHHQRKATADNARPRSLADVFGSTWITAGAGSVILLWGEAGDPLVELRHLKQPSVEVGPLTVAHDHAAGTLAVHEAADLRDLVRRATSGGVTAAEAARQLFGSAEPTANEREKARRRLEGLVREGHAAKAEGAGAGEPTRYRPVDARRKP